MVRWLAKLKDLNQRWLYLATVILLIVPLAFPMPMPRATASRATRGLYDMIEACPPGQVVLIDSGWDMGSRAECQAQLACVVRHLCRKRIPFVVVSLGTPFSPDFADKVIAPIAAEFKYVYGRDWVNTGFVQSNSGMAVVIDGLCRDFHKIRPTDVRGTPADKLPLMARVRTIRDVYMVYVVNYAPAPEWISFARGQHGTPVAFGCMSIMAPDYYRYIDSGQLSGMLIGNLGSAQYEALLHRPAMGTRLIGVASFGNAIVILAALLGNIGLWAAARGRRHRPQ
jgi:hypothetical protein